MNQRLMPYAVKTACDLQAKGDGAWKRLMDQSHRPHHRPNAHTDAEITLMAQITREYGFLPPLLMYQELPGRGYRRSYGGLKRVLRKHAQSRRRSKVLPEKPKTYDDGASPGEQVQLDVKYVPRACRYGGKLYQYALVDEYSRWCYREIYAEHSDYATSQFLLHAVKAAPFRIREVQTGNGHGFTNALFGHKKLEASRFELALRELGIAYRRIRMGPSGTTAVSNVSTGWTPNDSTRIEILSLADARSSSQTITLGAIHASRFAWTFTRPDQTVAGCCC